MLLNVLRAPASLSATFSTSILLLAYVATSLVAWGRLAPDWARLGYALSFCAPLIALLLRVDWLALFLGLANLALLVTAFDAASQAGRMPLMLDALGFLLLNVVLPLLHVRTRRALEMARHDVHSSLALFEDLFQSRGLACALCDADGRIQRANNELADLFALSDATALHGRSLPELLGASGEAPLSALKTDSEWLVPATAGGMRYLLVKSCQRTPEGQNVILIEDLTAIRQIQRDLHRSHEHTQFLARHDRLTGLPNRDYLVSTLDAGIRATPRGMLRPLLALRLVSLRHVNARFGLDEGDRLLARFAQRLREAAGPGAIVARIRGVVFGVVMPEAASAAAAMVAVSSLQATLPLDAEVAGEPMRLSLAMGLALHSGDRTTADDLMRQCEVAMDLSRRRGENSLSLFDAETARLLERRITLEMAFTRALAARELRMVYQPKVDGRGRLCGFEALARWPSRELGPVPPAEFVAVAEEAGWICQLSDWVLDEACRQIALWLSQGLDPVRVAVNLSARDLERSDLFQSVLDVVARHHIKPQMLEIEVTETCLATQPEQVIRQLRMLHEGGFRIAIDDFGSGYSSLAKLVDMPVSTVKIDRAFLAGLPGDVRRERVVRTIVSLAQGLSLELVAEGVETVQQLTFLQLLGCDVFQGFYFHKPGVAAQWGPLLRANVPADVAIQDFLDFNPDQPESA